MNDDHIRSLACSRSDVVYNIVCGGTQMASDFYWIVSRNLTPIHMLNHGISNDNYFFFWCRVYNTMIFFIIQIFIFSQFNLGLLLSTGLYFLSLGDLLPLTEPLWLNWIYWTGTWWNCWSTSLLSFSNNLAISFCLLKMPSFKKLFSDSRYLTLSLSNIKFSDFSIESSYTLPLILKALIWSFRLSISSMKYDLSANILLNNLFSKFWSCTLITLITDSCGSWVLLVFTTCNFRSNNLRECSGSMWIIRFIFRIL